MNENVKKWEELREGCREDHMASLAGVVNGAVVSEFRISQILYALDRLIDLEARDEKLRAALACTSGLESGLKYRRWDEQQNMHIYPADEVWGIVTSEIDGLVGRLFAIIAEAGTK